MGITSSKKKKSKQPDVDIINNYYPKNGYTVSKHRLDAVARVLLMGVYDDNNILSAFRGMRYLLKEIWELTIQFNNQHYIPYIELKDDPDIYNQWHSRRYNESVAFKRIRGPAEFCYWRLKDERRLNFKDLTFPKPLKKEININMMPFKMDPHIMESQLPNH
eukprot:97384_1